MSNIDIMKSGQTMAVYEDQDGREWRRVRVGDGEADVWLCDNDPAPRAAPAELREICLSSAQWVPPCDDIEVWCAAADEAWGAMRPGSGNLPALVQPILDTGRSLGFVEPSAHGTSVIWTCRERGRRAMVQVEEAAGLLHLDRKIIVLPRSGRPPHRAVGDSMELCGEEIEALALAHPAHREDLLAADIVARPGCKILVEAHGPPGPIMRIRSRREPLALPIGITVVDHLDASWRPWRREWEVRAITIGGSSHLVARVTRCFTSWARIE